MEIEEEAQSWVETWWEPDMELRNEKEEEEEEENEQNAEYLGEEGTADS